MRPFSASHASSQSVMVATATPVLSRASRMASRASLDNCFGSLAIQTRPDHPTEEMPKPHDRGQESYRIPTSRRFTKSLIPRMRAVLRRGKYARKLFCGNSPVTFCDIRVIHVVSSVSSSNTNSKPSPETSTSGTSASSGSLSSSSSSMVAISSVRLSANLA